MTEVRKGKLGDIGDILDYIKEYHSNSNMSGISFDRVSTAKIVEHYIRHRDTLPLIAIGKGERIIGILFGSLEPYFFNQKKNYATDLMFFSNGAGPQLWRAFREWAFGVGADRIIMGVSSGDPRVGQLLETLGMNATGGMYELRSESS